MDAGEANRQRLGRCRHAQRRVHLVTNAPEINAPRTGAAQHAAQIRFARDDLSLATPDLLFQLQTLPFERRHRALLAAFLAKALIEHLLK